MPGVDRLSEAHGGRCVAGVFSLAVFFVGCDGSGGLSHREQVVQTQQQAADAINAKGGMAFEKQHALGQAWTVDLSKATIDDEVVEHLGTLGQISHLDLSGSTITDQQLAAIATLETPLFVLDISDTQVTDAGLMSLTNAKLLAQIKAAGSKVTKAGVGEYLKKRGKHPMGMKIDVKI